MTKNRTELQKRFDGFVQMYHQRFRNYEENSTNRRDYRYSIKVYFDDQKQPVTQTMAMVGADAFLHRIKLAEEMTPSAIEIIELDGNGKPVLDGSTYCRLQREKRIKAPRPKKEAEKNDNDFGGGMGNLDPQGKFEVLSVKHEMGLVIKDKDYEISQLKRENDQLQKELDEVVKENRNFIKEKENGGLMSTLNGFVKEQPGLFAGILGKLTGATGLGETTQQTPAIASLAGVSEERQEIMSEIIEVVNQMNDEQFQKYIKIMAVIQSDYSAIDIIEDLVIEEENKQQSNEGE
jgi:hypothetical protein